MTLYNAKSTISVHNELSAHDGSYHPILDFFMNERSPLRTSNLELLFSLFVFPTEICQMKRNIYESVKLKKQIFDRVLTL